jgi:hypothetical protein
MFQPTHCGHHQANITEFNMFVHKRMVCQRDPVLLNHTESRWHTNLLCTSILNSLMLA